MPEAQASEPSSQSGVRSSRALATALVRQYLPFVWRLVRRLGLSSADADDAAQQVFCVASQRLADIAEGSERAFLFSTALHVVSKAHRARSRRRDEPDSEIEAHCDSTQPLPDELVDQRRARELLDRILDDLPMELKLVFVLYEIEELTMAEIAEGLGIPPGTVASRLRRARKEFSARVEIFERGIRQGGAR
jgi:RNA polymerase sigma-70 factor (ECF subfamily)